MDTYENKFEDLYNQFKKLQKENEELKNRVDELENKRNENYYQRFLERKLSATHKRTKFGITDITTDTEHIEIKHWRNYKAALGQLLSYNFKDNKNLCVYFFGHTNEKQKENIIELYRDKMVNIRELVDTQNGIEIQEVFNINTIEHAVLNTSENEIDNFYKWLSNHIVFEKNSFIRLEEICYKFTGESNLHSSRKQKYKIIIENFIKDNFQNIKWKYGVINIYNNKTTNGWKYLSVV